MSRDDFPCPGCKQTFETEAARWKHRREYHGWRPPPPHASIRMQMGDAAYTQWRHETGQLPTWAQLTEAERAMWQRIARAANEARIAAEHEADPPF